MQKVQRVEAWYYNPTNEDKRLPHQFVPNRPVPAEHLDELGVLTWKLDADAWQSDPQLGKIKEERGYNYCDEVTVAPGMLKDYDEKIHHFYQEHLHDDEEIRFALDGSAYFDVRDYNEAWIRFRISKGDLIVLPAGIYHRFTLDMSNYMRVLRMFKDSPCWTQYHRPAEHMNARKLYVDNFINKNKVANSEFEPMPVAIAASS